MIIQYDDSGEITGTVTGSLSPTDFQESVIEVPDGTSTKNKKVDTENDTLVWDCPLSDAKKQKINEVKDRANEILSKTDWYIIRKQETGEAIPQNVLDHRSKVRSESDTFEQEINNLSSVSNVFSYKFSFDSPPA